MSLIPGSRHGIQPTPGRTAMLLAAVLAATPALALHASDVPSYTVTRIGLWGPEYAQNGNYYFSAAYGMNDSGAVVGQAYRYSGSFDRGRASWLYNAGRTIRTGFFDATHTRSDGYQLSSPKLTPNALGQSSGTSERYKGSTSIGQSAWFYDGTSTIRIGLFDATHTRSTDNFQSSSVLAPNDMGQVAGDSSRFLNGTTNGGSSAWLFSNGTSTRIGLYDTEHTRNDGFQSAGVRYLDQSGGVAGYSKRYAGTTNMGLSAWYSLNGVTTRLGMVDASCTRSDGYQESLPWGLSSTGKIVGESLRYSGTTDMGKAAWLFDGTNTIRVGLLGANYSRSDGYQFSFAEHVNNLGQVAGGALLYSGNDRIGTASWIQTGPTATRIGLYDAQHTSTYGVQVSLVDELNDNGQVAGLSERYSGTLDRGQSAWLYTGGITRQIGLTDQVHFSDDDYHYSQVRSMNNDGQVAGITYRYGGMTQMGQSAWVYDPVLNQTLNITPSVRSDGYAYAKANVNEHGLVSGTYEKYIGNWLEGVRAFVWTRSDGLFDLNDVLDSSSKDPSLHKLTDVLAQSTPTVLVGIGSLNAGQGSFLLTPSLARWANPASGDFSDPSKWQANIAPVAGNNVVFNVPGAHTVSVTRAQNVRAINILDGDIAFHLSGGSLNIAQELRIGDPVLTPAVTSRIRGGVVVTETIQVYPNGALETQADAVLTTDHLAVWTDATFLVNAGQFTAHGHTSVQGELNWNDGILTLHSLAVEGSGIVRLAEGRDKYLQLENLTISADSGASLDLADNQMRIANGDLVAIAALVGAGRNGGTWTGTGIRSSSAAEDPSQYTLGVKKDGADVLVKFTYAADANLDGVVNVGDLGILASNWNGTQRGFWQADFNNDGVVNVGDLGILASTWNKGAGNPLSLEQALVLFPELTGVSAPEPASVLLLGGAMTCILTRRKRR